MKIVYPIYKNGKLLKDGSIDGVPMKEIWKQCQKETREWLKTKPWWKKMVADSKIEQAEIDAYWKSLTKEQKKKIKETKGTYIS